MSTHRDTHSVTVFLTLTILAKANPQFKSANVCRNDHFKVGDL